MENTAWVLYRDNDVSGVYTSYKKAMQALMMRAALPILSFNSEFDIDFYEDNNHNWWNIEEFETDKI